MRFNFNWLNETLQLRNNNSGFKFIFFVVHLQVIETSWTPYNNFSASCSNFNAVTAYINWLKMKQPDSMIRYCVSNIASLFSFCLILWAMSVQCHAFPSYILSYDPLNLPDKRLFSFQLYLPSFTDLHSHETPYVLRSPGEPIFRLLVGNWLWRSKVGKPVTFSSCNRIPLSIDHIYSHNNHHKATLWTGWSTAGKRLLSRAHRTDAR